MANTILNWMLIPPLTLVSNHNEIPAMLSSHHTTLSSALATAEVNKFASSGYFPANAFNCNEKRIFYTENSQITSITWFNCSCVVNREAIPFKIVDK